MAQKSKTVVTLEEQLREMGAYREAFFCLRAGESPVEIASGEDERRVSAELLGAHRACGGVVIVSGSVRYASDWCASARQNDDAYVQDLVHKVERAVSSAVHERVNRSR